MKLDGFPRSSTKDTVMRINLYTSTAFEGCDIYDRDGMTFIVSDTRKRHSLIDISTSMIQICGRVRDSRYGEIVHLYDTLPYKDSTHWSSSRMPRERALMKRRTMRNGSTLLPTG